MSEDRLAAAERLLGLKVLECDALRAALKKALPVLKDAPAAEALLDWNAIGPEVFQGVNLQGALTAARQALVGQPEEGK